MKTVSVKNPKNTTFLIPFPTLNSLGELCLIDFYLELGGLEWVSPKTVFINPEDNDKLLRRILKTEKQTDAVRFWLINGPQESNQIPIGSVLIVTTSTNTDTNISINLSTKISI